MRIIISVLLLALSFQSFAELPGCDKCVDTQDIAPKAVTSGKIAPDAVTKSKLAPGSVGSSELADGAITSEKLSRSVFDAMSSGLVIIDSAGRRLPFFLTGFGVDYSLDPLQYSSLGSAALGLLNFKDKMLAYVSVTKNSIHSTLAQRLYYSGANCSGDVLDDVLQPVTNSIKPYPLISPKTLVAGGMLYGAPLEIFGIGETVSEIAVQSYRDIGVRKVLCTRCDLAGPLQISPPFYEKDVCVNELLLLEKARRLMPLDLPDLVPPFRVKMP